MRGRGDGAAYGLVDEPRERGQRVAGLVVSQPVLVSRSRRGEEAQSASDLSSQLCSKSRESVGIQNLLSARTCAIYIALGIIIGENIYQQVARGDAGVGRHRLLRLVEHDARRVDFGHDDVHGVVGRRALRGAEVLRGYGRTDQGGKTLTLSKGGRLYLDAKSPRPVYVRGRSFK